MRHRGVDIENDAIIGSTGENRRNDALAVGVVERVVDRRRLMPKRAALDRSSVASTARPVRLQVAATSTISATLASD